MHRTSKWPITCLIATATTSIALAQTPPADDEPPKALQPLAHLVGAWKGQSAPTKDKLRGRVERHEWAWAFEDGRPVALKVTLDGGKPIREGRLSAGEAGEFRLDGTDAADEPVSFRGKLERSKGLVLDRVGTVDGAAERLTIRPNANKIRYTVWVDRKEPRSPAFARFIEMNLGREGVNFAAGGQASAEECVVTGGAATLTVSHEGKTYPLCCSGCQEQFLADPARYIAKAKLRAEGKGARPVAQPAGDDDFDGSTAAKPTTKVEPKPKAEPVGEPPAAEPAGEKRAAMIVKQGQALEKQGKAAAALANYRRVVRDFGGTAAAKTAGERIKALEPKH